MSHCALSPRPLTTQRRKANSYPATLEAEERSGGMHPLALPRKASVLDIPSEGPGASAQVSVFDDRLADPERVLLATRSAIGSARSEGRLEVTQDDLLAGLLRCLARLGVVWIGPHLIDLRALGVADELGRSGAAPVASTPGPPTPSWPGETSS